MSLALCLWVVSQASQHFRFWHFPRSKLLVRVALPTSLSARSLPFTPACPGHTPRNFRRWMLTIDTFQSGLPVPLFTFCSKLIESVRMMACVVWLSPLEAKLHVWQLPPPLSSWMLRPYRLHRLYGLWSHLAWQWSPTLTGLWWLSHQCTLCLWLWGLTVCCFLEWEAWSLTLFCLPAILDSAFPRFLAEVSRRDAGISLGTFPTPWFAWALSAGKLAVLSPLLDPSKTSTSELCLPPLSVYTFPLFTNPTSMHCPSPHPPPHLDLFSNHLCLSFSASHHNSPWYNCHDWLCKWKIFISLIACLSVCLSVPHYLNKHIQSHVLFFFVFRGF